MNLMALLAKLIRICVSERWSVLIRKSPSGADTSNFKFLPSASVRSVVLTSSMMDRQFKVSRFSSTYAGFNPGEVQQVVDERLFEAGHEGTHIMGGRIELLPR